MVIEVVHTVSLRVVYQTEDNMLNTITLKPIQQP